MSGLYLQPMDTLLTPLHSPMKRHSTSIMQMSLVMGPRNSGLLISFLMLSTHPGCMHALLFALTDYPRV